jgi:mycobactin lysine-N-oxygenase
VVAAHAVARDGRIRLTLSTNRGGEALGEPSETVHGFGLGGPLTSEALQESIGHDLAVSDVYPKLFLPGPSGLTQGPGFPNLSSLGLLADRVLGADLTDGSPSARSNEQIR